MFIWEGAVYSSRHRADGFVEKGLVVGEPGFAPLGLSSVHNEAAVFQFPWHQADNSRGTRSYLFGQFIHSLIAGYATMRGGPAQGNTGAQLMDTIGKGEVFKDQFWVVLGGSL